MHQLHLADYIVFLIYFVLVTSYGYYIYHKKKSASLNSRDFFLAEGSLTWWAIGASLIASNISAEHFIGMSGSGFALGLAISTYEWMAAATLIIVAIFFIPVYLKNKIYTMPQFLSQRYNSTVSTVMAVFWLLTYVFVNLTSILYLGALAIASVSGISFGWCIAGLAIFAVVVTLGGMKVIGYTDVFQVFVLILGGLVTTYLALSMVSEHFGYGKDIWKGLSVIREKVPDHFHMIFDKTNPYYKDLPGLSVLVGGMWINNLNYWGCNQYIIQRALGANLKMALLHSYTSVFTETGVNMNQGANATREKKEFYGSAPKWAQQATPLFIMQHRLRRLLQGAYHQNPFTYSIYTSGQPDKRRTFNVNKPTARWIR